jgi:hypothetical protein
LRNQYYKLLSGVELTKYQGTRFHSL